MRLRGRIALLVVLWLLAWGQFSAGNVVSGIAVAGALLVAFPPVRRSERAGPPVRIRLGGSVRLIGYVARQLVTSNLVMIREILRGRPRLRPGVLAHPLAHPSEAVITVVSSIIALSPGTMVVDVKDDPSTLYVHFLLLHDVDAARASLVRLERYVAAAISERPSPSIASEERS